MIYTISDGKIRASINTLGAELCSLTYSGEEYMWRGDIWPSHAPVLFPICGRLVDGKYEHSGKEYAMRIHGFAKSSEFIPEELGDARLVLSLASNFATLEVYPFDFKVYAIYEIKDDALHFDFKVENKGDVTMPFMFGWHPAFALWGEGDIGSFSLDFGDTTCLTHHLLTETKFVSGAMEAYPIEGGIYPLNEEELYSQDTLIFSDTEGVCRLYREGDEREVELAWSDNLPYLAIWKWPKSEARYLCLEPWSGIPGDGVTPEVLKKKVVVQLDSGCSETFSYTVKCK